MEKYAAELYAIKEYTGNRFGRAAHFLHTDTGVFPAGNRLFIRSVSHLYCIGDPAEPYCGRLRPAGVAVLDDPQPENLPAIVGRLSDQDRSIRLAAACALRRMGPAAAPAADALTDMFLSDAQAEAGYLGLRALGPAAAAGVERLIAYGRQDDAHRQQAITMLAGIGAAAVAAAEKLIDSQEDYAYGLAILKAVQGADDAKAVALVRALQNPMAKDVVQARDNVAELLKALGPRGGAAIPVLRALPPDKADWKWSLRHIGILAAIDPDLAAERMPEILAACPRPKGWRSHVAAYEILRKLGGRAKEALPELRADSAGGPQRQTAARADSRSARRVASRHTGQPARFRKTRDQVAGRGGSGRQSARGRSGLARLPWP